MSLLGQPTDADLNTYPHVLLTGPHEWDPSVLDYTHPTTSGDPTWASDPSLLGAHDPRIDEFGNFKGRVHLTEFRQPLQVQIHLEMPRILVQLGHIQRT